MGTHTCRAFRWVACFGVALVAWGGWVQPLRASSDAPGVKHVRSGSVQVVARAVESVKQPRRVELQGSTLPKRLDGADNVAGLIVPGTLVYSNEDDPVTSFYPPGAGQRMADDIVLASDACNMVYYEVAVFADGGAPYDVSMELWDGDPCAPGSAVIAGTETVVTGLEPLEAWLLSVNLEETPVGIPKTPWVALTFTSADAGWLVTREAEIGSTADFWSENDPVRGCTLLFLPNGPYAGYWTNISCDLEGDVPGACCDGVTCTEVTEAECTVGVWQGAFTKCSPNPCQPGACCTGPDFASCTDTTEADCSGSGELFHPDVTCAQTPCSPAFLVFENDFDTGIFDTILQNPANPQVQTLWADDLVFGPGTPCDLVGYDLIVVGTLDSTSNFDVHTQLWSNDDNGTPGDPTDDLPATPIAGTEGHFVNVPADQIGHTVLAGPFDGVVLDDPVWLVFGVEANPPGGVIEAGPLLGGADEYIDVGMSEDGFAIFNDPDLGPNIWVNGVWYMGFIPEGCPGAAPCQPAGSFQITVWCAGEPPRGACCTDAAGTCVDNVTQVQCDGRWIPDATCDSNPFDPPCGTAACCQIFGCADIPPADCALAGGAAARGAFCDDPDFSCPRNACFDAAGRCTVPHVNPGCEDPFCCEAVCEFDSPGGDSFCCTTEWDSQCASDAQALCSGGLSNDHCGDADPISGEGLFDFDNRMATTDGAPNAGCTDTTGEQQIAKDVWYCWTASCTGPVSVQTCGLTDIDTKVAVYEGCDTCPPTDAELVGCNDDACTGNEHQSHVVFDAMGGQQYLIRVGSYPIAAETGVGQFSITCGLPQRDECPGDGDCCTDTDSPACNNADCCNRVCACDPFCCEVEWDTACSTTGLQGLGCGAEIVCESLCTGGGCPNGPVTFDDPPSGVVDARQPYPPGNAAQRQGIKELHVTGPAGIDRLECWSLCETVVDGGPNSIESVVDDGGGSYTVTLARSISTGAVTTVTYTGGDGVPYRGEFTSHPGNVNGDQNTAPNDVLKLIDYLNGAAVAPWGLYSYDVDHSGLLAPQDVLREIDLLNGAGAFISWINSGLPDCGACCPE